MMRKTYCTQGRERLGFWCMDVLCWAVFFETDMVALLTALFRHRRPSPSNIRLPTAYFTMLNLTDRIRRAQADLAAYAEDAKVEKGVATFTQSQTATG